MTAPSYGYLLAALGGLVFLLALASLAVGPAAAGLPDFLRLIAGGERDTAVIVIQEIRLPRTILAAMVGASLGLSGAALQGYLRNPLAEPGVIGVSSSAALGAVIAIYTGLTNVFEWAVPVLAIAGAMIAAFILQMLARTAGVYTLILAGITISSLAGAMISLALSLSPNPIASFEIVFWMLGSITDRSMDHVALAGPFMAIGWVLLLLSAPALKALSLGEEAASSLGVDLSRTKFFVIAGSAVSVGAATAVTGVIGFVGLVAPHFLRPLVGHDPARLLPASALGGAILLIAADIFVRLITPGTEVKLGVVTSMLGAPFFLWMIIRARREFAG